MLGNHPKERMQPMLILFTDC